MKRKLALALFALTALNAYAQSKDTKEYLRIVLGNLEKVESAAYNSLEQAWAPGDTAASVTMNHFVKEYNNPLDSTIGASFVALQQEDTTQMAFCYDGKMKAQIYEDEKTIMVDSFKVIKLPYRPLSAPFFNYAKSILKYALQTNDSISIKLEERKDAVYFSLVIFEGRQVEFFGKAFHMDKTPYDFGETTSRYEIWIDKATSLPFKTRREMSHDVSAETVSNVNLNKSTISDFNASDYFMPGHKITFYRAKSPNSGFKRDSMVGRKAPDWMLKDASDKPYGLDELKGKVVLVQFTSVSCGPCRMSIPFLNTLASAYGKKDFDFVAVECTSKSLNALKSYQNKNKINYKLLMSTKNVLDQYKISSYPVFFILDKNLVVRKVIKGYGEGTSDKEIKAAIGKLLR